jgi:hypothetical protein
MKKKVIKHFGGDIAAAAKTLDVSTQRIYGWSDQLTKLERDGIIAAAVRQGLAVPKWLLHE